MTNTLTLAAQKTFETMQCDFYRDTDEFYMTREQIGQALGYADPRVAIKKIHDRNADRLDELSAVTKLVTTDGKAYDTFTYNLRGVMEICRLSRQPKADKFMDFVWDVMESLYKGNSVLAAPNQQTAISPEAFQSMATSVFQIEKILAKVNNGMIQFGNSISSLEQKVQRLSIPAPEAKQQIPAQSAANNNTGYKPRYNKTSEWKQHVFDTIDKVLKNQPGRFADGKSALGYLYGLMRESYGFSVNREKTKYMNRHPRSTGNCAIITMIEDDESWRKVFDRMLADLYQDSVDHSPLDENGNMPIPVTYDSNGLVEFGCPHYDSEPVEGTVIQNEPVPQAKPAAPAVKTPNPANGDRIDTAVLRVADKLDDRTYHFARSYAAIYNIMQLDWDDTFKKYEAKFGRKAHQRRELFLKSDVLTARFEAAADVVCSS